MIRKLALILTILAATCVPAPARPPAGFVAFSFPGDVDFATGGMAPEFLTGAYVKSATVSGDTLTIQAQGVDGHDLADVTFTGVSEWIHLDDTPAGITADLCVKGNSAGDGLVFGPCLSAGTSDGVVQGMTLTGGVLSLTRSAGLSTLTVTLPFRTDQDIDGRIASWARLVSPSGTVPDARIPAAIARDTEIDPRIASYARIAPTGTIPDAQVPATFTRDTEVQDSCIDLTYSGSTLSCVQRDGTSEQVTITTTGTTDGVVTGGSVSGTTLTLTRSQSLADVTITGLPSGGAGDITAVTTASDSGLSGGAVTGAVALELNFENNLAQFGSVTFSDGDDLFAMYNDDDGDEIALTLGQLKAEVDTQRTDAQINALIASGALQPGNITGGTNVTVTTAADGVTISAQTGGTANTISAATPQVVDNTAAAGSTGDVSDAGHAHAYGFSNVSANLPGAVSVTSAAYGTSAWAARANHVHGLGSDARARLLPASPADDQIARYDAGTSAWVAENLPAGGASDGVVTAGSYGSGTITLTRSQSLADVTVTGIPQGDITGVTTSVTSGLSGGADTGAPALVLDIDRLPVIADIAGDDELAMVNESSVGDPTHKVDLSVLLTAIAGDNITYDAANVELDATAAGGVTEWTALTDTPASITASQCVQGNAGATALVFGACGTGGGGVTTFLGLSDTPGAFTSASGYVTRVNSAGDALEFVAPPAPSHQILNVGSLPDPTVSGSPDLVYLTHDYTEGNPQDATLTVGFEGNAAGYSDGAYLQEVFGSINESSPLNAIFGAGDASDYSLQSVLSFNESWINEFTHVEIAGVQYPLNPSFVSLGAYERRIQGSPTGLSAATVTLNFRRADGTWYWTDGGDERHEAGLYEKVGNPPAYHDLAPIEDTHRSGAGTFACGDDNPPTDGGQVCIDSDGHPYFSTDRTVLVTEDAQITAIAEFTSAYWQGAGGNVLSFDQTGENGEFKWYLFGDLFLQIQGTRATATINITGTANTVIPSGTVFERSDVPTSTHIRTTAEATIPAGLIVNNVPVEAVSPGASGNNIPATATWEPDPALTGVTSAVIQTGFSGGTGDGLVAISSWNDIWEWIASVDDADSAADQTLHESLRDNSAFLGEVQQQSEAAEERDAYAVTTDRYFYIVHGSEDTIQEITGFEASVNEEQDEHVWVGPVITIEDVHDVLEVNPDEDPQARSFSSIRVGDNVYTAIVRYDETTGVIRDPVEADWDHQGWSRSIGWDGSEWLEVQRYFAGAHTADAVFTEVPSGTTISSDSGTRRWRGAHSSGSPSINPNDGDFIYWTSGGVLREYVVDVRSFSSGWVTRSDTSFLARTIRYIGSASDQDDALALVTPPQTGDGDRVIYERSPERARGTIRFAGADGTHIPLGTRVRAEGSTDEFELIDGGTIDDTGEIDLDARAVVGGTDGNVADDTVFTHSITGVTAAMAEGAFTRGDDVSGGYRLFTISEFSAPAAAEISYRWVPVFNPDDFEVVIGPDPATGRLRDATDDDYDEGHGQSRVLGFDGTELQRAGRRVVGGTGATGTWTIVSDGTEIHSGRRWRDSHYQDYLVTDPQHGDTYFNLHTGFRDYDGSNWHAVGTAVVFNAAAPRYLGSFSTNQQASDFATADGQWALIIVSGRPRMHSLSGYAPAAAEHYEYFWTPINVQPRIPPVPFTASDDQILRWSQSAGLWNPTQIVTGATIDGIGTAGDPLVVSINDVTEQLQESISYHSSGDLNYTTKGATVAEIFSTGPYQTCVTRVRANIESTSGSVRYVARLMQLNDNNNNVHTRLGNSSTQGLSTTGFHSFDFSECVTIPTSARVAVMISRTDGSNDSATFLRFGTEANNSPDESYDDASTDWNYVGWAEYEHTYPNVGHGTVDHDESDPDTYGDMQIRYRRTFDHGTLVGDGNVDLAHLDSDVTARLLPGSPADDQIARYDSGTSAWVAENLPSSQRTQEEIEDFVGGMVTGNTETGVTVTYQDSDGTLDFDAQTAGDARYAQTAASNTFTAANTYTATQTVDMDPSTGSLLEIDAREATSTGAVFNVIVGETFRARKGFSISRNVGAGLTGWAWATFDYDECGNSLPGFSLGPGGDGENRDVEWCRGEENQWRTGTNDTILAGAYDVQATGLATTKTNLEIPEDFTDLDDTPGTITANQCVMGNGAGDALVFGACGTGGGATTFLGLTDTPAAFGTAGQHVVVNAAADGLEFAAAPTGSGAGILLQKHVLTDATQMALANTTWTTRMSQAITVAGATDRVYVHATVSFQFLGAATAECDVRVLRGTTQVGTVSGGAAYVQQEIHPVQIMVIDDSPGAGTYTYSVQVQDADDAGGGECTVNPQGTASWAEIEVLSANP